MTLYVLLGVGCGATALVVAVAIRRHRSGPAGSRITMSMIAVRAHSSSVLRSRRTPLLIPVPRPPCVAWLYVSDGPTMQGETIPLRAMCIKLGADTKSDIVIEGHDIPDLACTIGFMPDELHAVLTVEVGALVMVNGAEALQLRLNPRDVISVGSYSFIYFDSVWRA